MGMNLLNKISYFLNSMNEAVNCVEGTKTVTFADIVWCGMRYGASPNNYVNFDLKNANSIQRKTYLTHRRSEYLMKKYNDSDYIWQLEDKYAFAVLMGDQYGRSFAKSNTLSKEDLLKIINNDKIIYKPLKGGQGIGIKVFDKKEYPDINKMLLEIQRLPEGIVEEWILQDERMSMLYPDAVNPIRIQSLRTDNVHIIAATITIANDTNIANASGQKAIFALVDVNNGVVITDGYDYNGNSYITHPMTGVEIKGFEIPQWDEVKYLVKEASKKIKNVRYIGWDIAISKNGPIIIEANNDPGYTAYQLPLLTGEHKGIWPIYKKYIS